VIDESKQIFDGMPEGMSDNTKIEILDLVKMKKDIIEKQTGTHVDPAFKEQKAQEITRKIAEIDTLINKAVNRSVESTKEQ